MLRSKTKPKNLLLSLISSDASMESSLIGLHEKSIVSVLARFKNYKFWTEPDIRFPNVTFSSCRWFRGEVVM